MVYFSVIKYWVISLYNKKELTEQGTFVFHIESPNTLLTQYLYTYRRTFAYKINMLKVNIEM